MRATILTPVLALVLACAPTMQEFRASYPDGKPREVFSYFLSSLGDTIRHGQYCRWYTNGKDEVVGYYQRGLPDSVWRRWTSQGMLSIEANWRSGVLHGPYHNELAAEAPTSHAYPQYVPLGVFGDSAALRYYASGQFVNGKREGKWLELYPNPAWPEAQLPVAWVGRCSAGVRVGPWVTRSGFFESVRCSTIWYGAGARTGVVADCTDSLRRVDSLGRERSMEDLRRAMGPPPAYMQRPGYFQWVDSLLKEQKRPDSSGHSGVR